MMITPYLSRFRNAEFIQYMRYSISFATEANQAPIQDAIAQLSTAVEAIEAIFLIQKSSNITQELINLDARRDKAIIGLRMVIEGLKYHPDNAIATAAIALFKSMNKHGTRISKLNYQEETAVLDSLIDDWETDSELVAALNTLNFQNWLAELKDANTNFVIAYAKRVKERAENPTESIPNLRVEATKAFRNLIDLIAAHITLNTDESYKVIQNKLEVMSAEYNQVVDNRTTNNEEEE